MFYIKRETKIHFTIHFAAGNIPLLPEFDQAEDFRYLNDKNKPVDEGERDEEEVKGVLKK